LVFFGLRIDFQQAITAAAEAEPGKQRDVIPDTCWVSLIHDVSVPAQKPGVLASVRTRAGMNVKKGDVLAEIDNTEAELMVKAAELKVRLARERAGNDIRVQFAKAAVLVAESEHQQASEANRSNPGTVPAEQIRRLALSVKRARLEIEQAESDLVEVQRQVELAQVELAMAQANLKRHTIAATIDGVIAEVFVQTGEWASPGTPICRVIQLDPLHVEGFVDATLATPGEIAGKKVQIETQPTREESAKFVGEIVFVSSILQAPGGYRVLAKVDNRRVNGHWVLLPGMVAEMTLDVQNR
jgi:multidrug resistance efflux pump